MSKKKRTVIYRRANVIDASGNPADKTLELLFRDALLSNKIKFPIELQSNSSGHIESLLLHTLKKPPHVYNRDGFACGCVSFYDTETKVALVDAEYTEKGEIYSEYVPPTDSQSKERKLEQQSHIFAIKDNHVAIMASSRQGCTMIHRILSYVIFEKAQLIEGGSLELINIPSSEVNEKIKGKNIRKITLSGTPCKLEEEDMTEDEIKKEKAENPKRRKFTRIIPRQTPFFNILQCLFQSSKPQLSCLEENSEMAALSMAIAVSCHTKTAGEAQEIVNDIAHHFADIEDLSTTIEFDDKSTVKGENLTVKGSIELDVATTGTNRYTAMTAVAEWLHSIIIARVV